MKRGNCWSREDNPRFSSFPRCRLTTAYKPLPLFTPWRFVCRFTYVRLTGSLALTWLWLSGRCASHDLHPAFALLRCQTRYFIQGPRVIWWYRWFSHSRRTTTYATSCRTGVWSPTVRFCTLSRKCLIYQKFVDTWIEQWNLSFRSLVAVNRRGVSINRFFGQDGATKLPLAYVFGRLDFKPLQLPSRVFSSETRFLNRVLRSIAP